MVQTSGERDRLVLKDVVREFEYDPTVPAQGLLVNLLNGTVTLTGTVETFQAKIAAQHAAQRVHGVQKVVNDIIVSSHEHRSDDEIASAARLALDWDGLAHSSAVQLSVSSGWIALTGNVETLYEKRHIEEALCAIKGVRGFSNGLAVVTEVIPRETVKRNIIEALERQAEIDAEHIFVEFRDGNVVLSGAVRGWHERIAALTAAARARGVLTIEDRMRIEPAA